jgi:hypothetical protein
VPFESLWVFAATAVITLVVGTSASKAVPVEIDFGALAPTTNTCAAAVGGDSGKVCGNGLTFTTDGNTFTATGYAGVPGTSTATPLR